MFAVEFAVGSRLFRSYTSVRVCVSEFSCCSNAGQLCKSVQLFFMLLMIMTLHVNEFLLVVGTKVPHFLR